LEERSFWQVNSRKVKNEVMAGREARNTDKVRRPSLEDKQRKLTTEKKEGKT